MSEALDAALGGRTASESTAVLPKAGDDASAMIPITVGSSVQVSRPTAPRSRAPLIVVLLLVLLAAGGVVVYFIFDTTDRGPGMPAFAHDPPAVPAPAPVVVTPPPVVVAAPAPTDPADEIAASAKALADSGKVDKAIDTLVKARATYPDRAVLPLLAGKLYFSKLWWNDGIASFRAAFKLDASLKTDPEVIQAAVHGFLTTPAYDARLANLVLELGHAAVPALEDAAQNYRDPKLRARAAALAKRL
jgi:hypothetical protein